MGMISRFLRVSGSQTKIDMSRWHDRSHKKETIFTDVLKRATDLRQTSRQFQQISDLQHTALNMWCYCTRMYNKYCLSNDVVVLIASFLPIAFVSLQTFGEVQNEWKIHGYWYADYCHALSEAYSCMLISNDIKYSKKQEFYQEKMTLLMEELETLKPTDTFIQQLTNVLDKHGCGQQSSGKKRKIESCAPRIEFQYEENCLFFIEFKPMNAGINIGFVDYMHNVMQSPDQLNLWDFYSLQLAFCTFKQNENGDIICGGNVCYCHNSKFDEIDELMRQIPTRLLSAAVFPNLVNRQILK